MMRLVRTRHPLLRLTIIAAVGGILAVSGIYINRSDREAINTRFAAPDLRQIKAGLDQYVQQNGGTYPTRLEVLADSHLIDDPQILAGISFPAAGKRRADLLPSEYVIIQPVREQTENTHPRFALRADGLFEILPK